MDKFDILRTYYGFTAFREGQEALIDALLSGRDAFGVMPTGGGKSLCYQIPAILLPGVALLVSPLISLMKDQVMSLRAAGIPAAYINSSLSLEEYSAVCGELREGKYKIVYVAPERLENEGFLALAQSLPVSLVAVDEAHCISQWGQDFRPSYLKIRAFVEALPLRPALAAFTATATARVREDVVELLGLRDPLLLVTGFDRPNLRYDVIRTRQKDAALRSLLAERPGQGGIVYCATRKNVDRVCEELCGAGFAATRYHAGLSDRERHENQEDFVYDRAVVMVATNAFGMGIDKSNVRFVIHYNMPKSLEEYYQEAGRAGRDGEAADCVLLYADGDVTTAKFLIEHGNEENRDEAVIAGELERLKTMVEYCRTKRCLRGYILDYFEQAHKETCGNCGNCLAAYDEIDMTTEAQMALSCVKRIEDRLGYNVGAGTVAAVLRGSRRERIRELGLDGLSTYGLMRGMTTARIRAYLETLVDDGYLRTDPRHGGLALTAAAGDVLFRGKRVTARLRHGAEVKTEPAAGPRAADEALFERLRVLRRELAAREGVAAYIVFSDAALRDMTWKKPRDMDGFLAVSGVGKYKAEKYGAAFLREIAEYERGKTY